MELKDNIIAIFYMYIIFFKGLFLAMSLPDFYRYVHGYDKDHIVPNVRGKYEKFGFKEPMDHGMIELYRYFCMDYHNYKAHYTHTLYVFITYL